MINLSLIPVVGVLLLIALSIFVTTRRSHRVAEAREAVERQRGIVLRADQENDETLVDNLLRGLGTDQAVSFFMQERTKLLPGVNPEAPAAWSVEQLEDNFRERLRRDIEQVNRRFLAPALIIATLIIGGCCITAALVYQFHSGPVGGTNDTVLDTNTP